MPRRSAIVRSIWRRKWLSFHHVPLNVLIASGPKSDGRIVSGSNPNEENINAKVSEGEGSGIQGRIIKERAERRVYGFVVYRGQSARSGRTLKLENSVGNCARMWIRRICFGFYPPLLFADNDARACLIAITGAICGSAAGVLYQRQECVPEDIRRSFFSFFRCRYPFLLKRRACFPFALFLKVIIISMFTFEINVSIVLNADKLF